MRNRGNARYPPEPPQPGFDVQQGRGQPAVLLIACGPAIDFAHHADRPGANG
jgi:hypothetical protein